LVKATGSFSPFTSISAMRLCAASRPVSSLPLSSNRSPGCHEATSVGVNTSRFTRRACGDGVQCTSGQRARSGGSNLAAADPSSVKCAWRVAAVGNDRDRQTRGVRRIIEDLDVEHRRQSAQALRADAQRIHLLVELSRISSRRDSGCAAGSLCLEFVHVDRFHQ
jgi:hypothetical protein